MRAASAIGLSICVLFLAACADEAAPAAKALSHGETVTATGSLTGQVLMYGGPLDPATGKQALNGAPGPDWTVTVRSGARVVARTTSDSSGYFSVHLAPGTYTLGCAQPQPVQVTAGTSTSAACVVPVR